MILAIGSDHRGFALKQHLISTLTHYQWQDYGAYDEQRSDYPPYAFAVSKAITSGQAQRGVLICGSGIGMSIAANRVQGIYAALSWNEESARIARLHDGANVLVLPSDFVTYDQACRMVEVWLSTDFLGGRYQDRLEDIDRT